MRMVANLALGHLPIHITMEITMAVPEYMTGHYIYSLQIFEGRELYQTVLFSTIELAQKEYDEQMKVGYSSKQLVIRPAWVITA